jgi:hypothetical protein
MQARSILRGGVAAGMRTLAAAKVSTAPVVSAAAIRSRAFHISRPAFAKGWFLALQPLSCAC